RAAVHLLRERRKLSRLRDIGGETEAARRKPWPEIVLLQYRHRGRRGNPRLLPRLLPVPAIFSGTCLDLRGALPADSRTAHPWRRPSAVVIRPRRGPA